MLLLCVLAQIKGLRPYSLHMTWTGGERAGKVARLREAGLWRGDALGSEYLSDDRFLAIDLAWPRVKCLLVHLSVCSAGAARTANMRHICDGWYAGLLARTVRFLARECMAAKARCLCGHKRLQFSSEHDPFTWCAGALQ